MATKMGVLNGMVWTVFCVLCFVGVVSSDAQTSPTTSRPAANQPGASTSQVNRPPPPPPQPIAVPSKPQPQRLFLNEDRTALLYYDNESLKEPPVVLKLHNRVEATTRVTIKPLPAGIQYEYSVVVHPTSPDYINSIDLLVSSLDKTSTVYEGNPTPDAAQWAGRIQGGPYLVLSQDMLGLGGAPVQTVHWFPKPDLHLSAGQGINLRLTSKFLPGFAEIYYGRYPDIDYPPDWGFEPTRQESHLLEIQNITKHVISVGPRYSPDQPKPEIANDILMELRYAMNNDNIPNSPWTKAAENYLGSTATGQTLSLINLRNAASSDLEKDMTDALAITFRKTP